MRVLVLGAVVIGLASFGAKAGPAVPGEPAGAKPYCQAIARAVDRSSPGQAPTFVASYQPEEGDPALPVALRGAAFTYDNALAAIGLVACGDTARANRIGTALVDAVARDRTFDDHRIRNAYRAGAVQNDRPLPPGWWDEGAKRWDEDAYQDGTSTGNAAWAALALLNLHQATGGKAYLRAAIDLLTWIQRSQAGSAGAPGYRGGVSGFDGGQQQLAWASTEHNIDVAAAAHWAARLTDNPVFAAMAQSASTFVGTKFQVDKGFFLLGTKPDGSDADPDRLALDVQVWPILGIPEAPADWRRTLGFADKHLRRGDGMTFAGFGPNRWTEGTAQAALAFRAAGAGALADGFLDGLPAHASRSGLLYATSAGEVPTGLSTETAAGEAFTYFHWPHLGATAWAALASLGWNPFTGAKVG